MPLPTVQHVLDQIRRLELLEPGQLRELRQDPEKDVKRLLISLVKRRWLTAYQVKQLLEYEGVGLVLGPYTFLHKLGEGGMGQVFKARHRRLNRVVALKLIRKERLDKPETIKRFHREMRAAAQLVHPNIVHTYDADEVDGVHFFTMEYVDGLDLATMVEQRGPLPVEEACQYVKQAALGLQHAFERGLVHRDVKPQNILVPSSQLSDTNKDEQPRSQGKSGDRTALATSNWQLATVKLLDMGLARLGNESPDERSSTMTQHGIVMGTPDYMAPEQSRDSHLVDIRADLYGLGCTLHFLLTGQPLFPGGSLGEKLLKHQLDAPPAIEKMRSDVPPGVVRILRKLLKKKPAERFQTPAELVAALDRVDYSAAPQAMEEPTPATEVNAFEFPEAAHSTSVETDTYTFADSVQRRRQHRVAAQRQQLILVGCVAAGLLVLVVLFFVARNQLLGETEQAVGPEVKTPPIKATRKDGKDAPPVDAARKREVDAEAALQQLRKAAAAPQADHAKLRDDMQGFLRSYGRTSAATAALELYGQVLEQVPSPLDQLAHRTVPASERAAWKMAGIFMPKELVTVLGDNRQRHWSEVYAVACSPDGARIASCSTDGAVAIWDVARMEMVAYFRESRPNCHFTCLEFTPDGQKLLVGGIPNLLETRSPATGEVVQAFPGQDATVLDVALTGDGSTALVLGQNGQLRVVDAASGSGLKRVDLPTSSGRRAHVAAPPKGDRAICFEDGAADRPQGVYVVDVPSAKATWHPLSKMVPIKCVGLACLGDTNRFVATDEGGKAVLAQLGDVELDPVTLMEQGAWSVAATRDGKRVALGLATPPEIVLFNVEEFPPKQIRRFKGHHARVTSVAFSANGARLVSGSHDGTVRLWDVNTGKEIQPVTGMAGAVNSVSFTADGLSLLTSGMDGKLRLWDVGKRRPRKEYVRPSVMIFSALTPDDRIAMDVDHGGGVYAWDLERNQPQQLDGQTAGINALAMAPDGKHLLTVNGSGFGCFYQLKQGEVAAKKLFQASNGPTYGVDYSVDGTQAVTAGADGLVRLWHGNHDSEIAQYQAGIAVPAARFLPDGRAVLFGPAGRNVCYLDLASARVTRTYERPNFHSVLAVSPDGKYFCGSYYGNGVLLWNVATGVVEWEAQLPGPVRDVKFAPDGRHIATANGNGTVYLFRVPGNVGKPNSRSAP